MTITFIYRDLSLKKAHSINDVAFTVVLDSYMY